MKHPVNGKELELVSSEHEMSWCCDCVLEDSCLDGNYAAHSCGPTSNWQYKDPEESEGVR